MPEGPPARTVTRVPEAAVIARRRDALREGHGRGVRRHERLRGPL